MTEPIPHADEADVAEQSQFAYGDLAGLDSPSGEFGDPYAVDRDGNVEADVGDLIEQRRALSDADDERRD